jgi:hypothetical protein
MSQTLSNDSQDYGILNRQPKNLNPLLPNKFNFFITKLPETSFSGKNVNIPSITLPEWSQVTNLNPIPRSGLNVVFDPLEIKFIVDRDLNNWAEISNWIRLMGMVKNSNDYAQVKLQQLQPGPEGGLVSDIQVILLTNESVPNIVFYFRDAFPTYLSGIDLTNETENPIAVEATVRFTYSYYDFQTVNSTVEPDE